MKFRTKLLLLILISSLLPITIISVSSYDSAKESLTKTAFKNLEIISDTEKTRILDVLDADFETVNLIVSRTAFKQLIVDYESSHNPNIQKDLQARLEESMSSLPNAKKIILLNSNTEIIVNTSDEAYYELDGIVQKKVVENKPFVDFVRSKTNLPLKVFGVPINYDDKKIGTLLVYFVPTRLIHAEINGFGTTGEFLLARTNEHGIVERILYDRDSGTTNLVEIDIEKYPAMKNALNGIEKSLSVIDYRGNHVFTVSRHIEDAGWGLVVKTDETEALSFLNQLITSIIIAYVLVFLSIIIVSLIATKSFMIPILSMRKFTQDIASGNYSEINKIPKEEELNSLYLDVEFMKEKLMKRENEYKKDIELKDQFINIAAHELKTPIQPILNYAKLGLRGWADPKHSLEIISLEGNRLQRITNNILDVSRIKSGTYKFNMKETSLNKLILNVVDSFSISNKDVIVNCVLTDDYILNVDEDKIAQVLSNVIGNAVKFTMKGDVLIKTTSDERFVKIIVEDSAGGIPSEIINTLFEKFATKSVNGSTVEGTGLGLFLSKHIVESHGGLIEGHNNDHGGATFVISLIFVKKQKIN